jgi:hypothetical protein
MSIDDVTTQLRSQLQEAFGVDGATYLMDRPPGGWSDLVTNESLDRRLDALDQSLRAEFRVLRSEMTTQSASLRIELHQELRSQTWRMMTATLSAMAILVAAMGVFVTLAKL